MTTNVLENVSKENSHPIELISYMLDNSIKVPQHILIEAIESQNNSKEKEEVLDKYIEFYEKAEKIKNNISNYIFGELDDESIVEINKDIIDVKEYPNISYIMNEIGLDLDLLKVRTMQLCVNLGLNQNDIDYAKSKAIEDQISSQEKVKLTDEYLKNIVNELKNSEEIKSSSEEYVKHINKDCKPLLVVEYNCCSKRERKRGYGFTTSQFELDEEYVRKVYFSRQPLSGILQTNSIDNSWIKIYQFDDNLTDYDMETIKSEVIANLKPMNFKVNEIKMNDKWLTSSMIKEVFNISQGTKDKTIQNIYESLGCAYEGYVLINDKMLYNKRVYRDAEKVYTKACNKKIKYNIG